MWGICGQRTDSRRGLSVPLSFCHSHIIHTLKCSRFTVSLNKTFFATFFFCLMSVSCITQQVKLFVSHKPLGIIVCQNGVIFTELEMYAYQQIEGSVRQYYKIFCLLIFYSVDKLISKE